MRDGLGNKVGKGYLILWHVPEDMARRGLVFRVADVSDGGLSVVGRDGERKSPASLTLVTTLPINAPNGQEPVLGDFICILDPQSQSAVERILDEGPLVSVTKKPQ